MTANFYLCGDDNRRVNKSNKILISQDTNVILKEDTNYRKPVLITVYTSDIIKANYLYIEEWQKWYFITDIDFSQQKVIFSCKEDVLMTYKDSIYNLECIIERQEKMYNQYLDDSEYKVYNYKRIQTKKFPSGLENPSFVLAVAGEV